MFFFTLIVYCIPIAIIEWVLDRALFPLYFKLPILFFSISIGIGLTNSLADAIIYKSIFFINKRKVILRNFFHGSIFGTILTGTYGYAWSLENIILAFTGALLLGLFNEMFLYPSLNIEACSIIAEKGTNNNEKSSF
jgi:hypothetical protein